VGRWVGSGWGASCLGLTGVRVCPGTTTLAATMAGPLFYPANAAGPELLTALREACEGGPSGAGRAGPMRRLVLELQEGIRDALPKDADPHQEQASMQVSSTPGAQGDGAGSGRPAGGGASTPLAVLASVVCWRWVCITSLAVVGGGQGCRICCRKGAAR
jgi:hypothetical protein